MTSGECQHCLAVTTQCHANSPEELSNNNNNNLFAFAENAVSLQNTFTLHVILTI